MTVHNLLTSSIDCCIVYVTLYCDVFNTSNSHSVSPAPCRCVHCTVTCSTPAIVIQSHLLTALWRVQQQRQSFSLTCSLVCDVFNLAAARHTLFTSHACISCSIRQHNQLINVTSLCYNRYENRQTSFGLAIITVFVQLRHRFRTRGSYI